MWFTVSYRCVNGAVMTEAVEAANRSECFAQIRSRGITPINVKEGKSGHVAQQEGNRTAASHSGGARRSAEPKPVKPRRTAAYVFIVALILLVGGGAWWWFRGNDLPPEEPTPKNSASPKEVKTAVKSVTKVKDVEPALKPHKGEKWVPKAAPEKTANVKPPEMESQDVINLRELNRKFYGTPIFKHDSENTIAGILSSTPGDRFLVDQLDPGFDRDFKESLNSKIEIFSDDPDDVKVQKEAVIAAKEQLAQILAKGESPGSVMSSIMKDLNEIADYRDKLEDNIRILCKEGSEQDIRDYLSEANKMLSEYNARQIEISPKRWQRIMRRIESEAAQKGNGNAQSTKGDN